MMADENLQNIFSPNDFDDYSNFNKHLLPVKGF